MKADALDRRILSELAASAKNSSREIAKKVGATNVTVLHRIRRLEEEGAIEGYRASLDYERLGYGLQAIIEIRSSKDPSPQFDKYLRAHPSVTQVFQTSGDYDIIIMAHFRNREEFKAFIAELKNYDLTRELTSRIILDRIADKPLQIHDA